MNSSSSFRSGRLDLGQTLAWVIRAVHAQSMCLGPIYERRQPERTQLYRIIADNWETFLQERAYEGRDVPKFIRQEFEGFLRCGILACGFGRVCCPTCGVDKLVAFSCKGRGFCPSCGARRMAEAAAILGDELIPLVPVRQFVVTFPPPLRLWLARSTTLATAVCNKVVAALTAHLRFKSGVEDGLAGFVIFMQRLGSAGNLNVHLHNHTDSFTIDNRAPELRHHGRAGQPLARGAPHSQKPSEKSLFPEPLRDCARGLRAANSTPEPKFSAKWPVPGQLTRRVKIAWIFLHTESSLLILLLACTKGVRVGGLWLPRIR